MSTGNAAEVLEEGEAAALGEAAKTVPFTAVVGADKHLTSLTLKIPAAGKTKAYDYVVNYADYGTAPKISVPTGAAATKAPAMAYEMLERLTHDAGGRRPHGGPPPSAFVGAARGQRPRTEPPLTPRTWPVT